MKVGHKTNLEGAYLCFAKVLQTLFFIHVHVPCNYLPIKAKQLDKKLNLSRLLASPLKT
eukprot:UN08313